MAHAKVRLIPKVSAASGQIERRPGCLDSNSDTGFSNCLRRLCSIARELLRGCDGDHKMFDWSNGTSGAGWRSGMRAAFARLILPPPAKDVATLRSTLRAVPIFSPKGEGLIIARNKKSRRSDPCGSS